MTAPTGGGDDALAAPVADGGGACVEGCRRHFGDAAIGIILFGDRECRVWAGGDALSQRAIDINGVGEQQQDEGDHGISLQRSMLAVSGGAERPAAQDSTPKARRWFGVGGTLHAAARSDGPKKSARQSRGDCLCESNFNPIFGNPPTSDGVEVRKPNGLKSRSIAHYICL
jgi:hypothetical protein